MRRRPALITVALAALAAAAVVGAVVVVGSPATTSAQERTVTVARGVIQSTVSGSGNLEPANQADVDFAASGEITHIYVKAGQHVGRDELLARVDPDAAKVALAQAEATVQSAQDALDQAETAASTTTTTTASAATGASATSSSGSGSSGATSTMTVAAAQASLDSAQLSVTSAEKDLAATTLRAPMAGTVTAVNGDVGTTVGGSSSSSSSSSSSGSGDATVTGGLGGGGASTTSSSSSSSSFITLAQLSRFKMQVSLSESDIGSVKVGQPATVTVNAASGEKFAARVSQIGVLSSSSSSGTSSAVSYPVTLTLDQTSGHLKAGMSATADIVTSQVTGIAVPSQALSGSTVTVEAADGTQSTQGVQTGVVGDSTTQIVSGLKVGDKLVVQSAAAAQGAAAGGTNQLNNAIGSRLGAGGLSGGFGGGGPGAGGGFGGGGRLPGGGGGTP
jgi:multidrug efflux pump subunit AcrA (membrane-fusion protein)